MAWNSNFKRGVDLPAWDWLPPLPDRFSYGGSSNAYDGVRYIYFLQQHGVTTTTASTTTLWRFDTWGEGWQLLATAISGNTGLDIEYDAVRNVLVMISGASLTSWQVFNLNLTPVVVTNVTCQPFVLTTMTPVLPAGAGAGSTISIPDDVTIPAIIDSGTVDTGSTTSNIVATAATATFGLGMVGLQVRFTSGALNGQVRTVTAINAANSLTVAPALASAPAAGVTFVVEMPTGTATSGTTLVLTDTAKAWPVNAYGASDVVITSGTGAGQRRRIASNTATALTLAAATTGNPRTGPFATTPDATSVYRIVPSSDFLYYQTGGGVGLSRIDLAQTTGAAWTFMASAPAASGGGANTFHPASYSPFQLMLSRGAATAFLYAYDIGANTWSTLQTFYGVETFTIGASVAMLHGERKIVFQKELTTRIYALDLLTGVLEPFATMPFANPTGYEGKRMRFVKTADGVKWLYALRAGGQEFFRVPLEWL